MPFTSAKPVCRGIGSSNARLRGSDSFVNVGGDYFLLGTRLYFQGSPIATGVIFMAVPRPQLLAVRKVSHERVWPLL